MFCYEDTRGVYLCLIFEKSIWKFITNSKKNRLRNKLDFLSSSNLIFTAFEACKNQFQNQIDFFDFLNLIFRNWKKIEWHSIFQKSSGDRQGESVLAKVSLAKMSLAKVSFWPKCDSAPNSNWAKAHPAHPSWHHCDGTSTVSQRLFNGARI